MTTTVTWPIAAVLLGLFALLGALAYLDRGIIGQIVAMLAGAAAGWVLPSPVVARPA